METQLVKIESAELEKVVSESGLAIQEGEEIKQSYQPFLIQLAEIQSQASKINFESPARIDEEIAGRLRKDTVKIRTGAEALKDTRKKMYLLRGNLEQAAYNLIAASCKLTEETFGNVEKAREIAEKKRKEILKAERIEMLIPYNVQSEFYDLANMPEESFAALLDGFKKVYEDRIAAEKKAEEDRIAKEKADAEERERIRIENEKLKAEAIEREKKAEKERKAREEKESKEQSIRESKEKAEQEAHEAELKKERDERERVQREFEVKAEAARKEAEAKQKAADAEREKLQNELKAKQDAEAKERTRIESERKAKELAEKQAAMAPDKEKLKAWVSGLAIPELTLKTGSAKIVSNVITAKFEAFKTWANQQIETL